MLKNSKVAMVPLLALAMLMLTSLTSGQGVDRIRDPETSGCAIIELVLERIEKKVLNTLVEVVNFNETVVGPLIAFLRRIAAVESDYGRADHTYRKGYHGGIWQVDEDDFNDSRIRFANINHLLADNATANSFTLYAVINSLLGIDWMGISDSQWVDLRKPLYSGLAAMLKLLLANMSIPADVADQGAFWFNHYHNNAIRNGTLKLVRGNFTVLADTTCTVLCQSYPDIVFVVDSSLTVRPTSFQIALDFIAGLVPHFQIGQNLTRIGVVTYSDDVMEAIALDSYFDASELSAAIRTNVHYFGGLTDTGKAIQFVTDISFSSSNGARDDGRSRVGIVMTDGVSQDDVAGPSNAARDAGINLIAIGIGNVNTAELITIAGILDQVYLVNKFSDLPQLSAVIKTASCLAAVALKLNTTLSAILINDEIRYLSFTVTSGENYTLHITAMNGSIIVYGSLLTAMPGPDAYDFKLSISDMELVATDYLIVIPNPAVVPQRRRRQTETDEESTLVLAFVGMSVSAPFEVNIDEGDNRRYGDLAVLLTGEKSADGTVFYVCEANCICEQAQVNMTVSTTEIELPVGLNLNQVNDRRVVVTLPSDYLGPLHCVISTPGVSGSEVFSTINITGKCKEL